MSKYPEHDKLRIAKKQFGTQHIGEFIDWLEEQGIVLCEASGYEFQPWQQISERTEDLLARYAEIDLAVIEQEKRAMLDELRQANA